MLNLTDMKKRRTFDREFKQMVVELSYNRKDLTSLAAEMDIGVDLIYRWRREALANYGSSFPGQGNKNDDRRTKGDAKLKKSYGMHN